MFDNQKLGYLKLEMDKHVGEKTATGVFVGLKMYALRGENTGKEKVCAKGICEWAMSDKKESFADRRSYNQQEKIGFDDIASMLDGYSVTLNLKNQQRINKNLLSKNVDNIKEVSD